jgi:hypothetical protein
MELEQVFDEIVLGPPLAMFLRWIISSHLRDWIKVAITFLTASIFGTLNFMRERDWQLDLPNTNDGKQWAISLALLTWSTWLFYKNVIKPIVTDNTRRATGNDLPQE